VLALPRHRPRDRHEPEEPDALSSSIQRVDLTLLGACTGEGQEVGRSHDKAALYGGGRAEAEVVQPVPGL
jgi:hypothetical protein